MFSNKKLLYKGTSKKIYDKIINTLELNNIKYTTKIKNKNKEIGPMIDKLIIGTLGQKEDFSYEYNIFIKKENYEKAINLVNKNY